MTDKNRKEFLENSSNIKDVINSTEQQILSGDVTNVYNEIEKTEKLISSNIPQALIKIYFSLQLMDSKKNFVKFINESEKNNLTQDDLNYLNKKAQEYRNIELPAKWNEMKHKLHFTKEVVHFKAWYYGLQQGRYKDVVENVKEYVVKEIIKNILDFIDAKNKPADIKKNNIISLLENNKIEDLKKTIQKLYKTLEKINFDKDPFFEIFDLFYLYYLYLKNDSNLEKKVLNNIFGKISKLKTIKLKLDFLKDQKNEIFRSLKNETLKKNYNDIFDSLIHFYEILNDKNEKEQSLKEIPAVQLEAESKIEDEKQKEKIKSNVPNKDFLEKVVKNEELTFENQIDILTKDFVEKELDYRNYGKQFEKANKLSENKENKNKLKEIIEVIKRLEKEVEPLLTIESKLSKINDWINVDYKDKDYIINVLKKEVGRFYLLSGREGGLLTNLLNGLDKAEDKIKYLKDSLNNLEYKFLIPTIKNLINNLKNEIEKDKINGEWINKNLTNKNDDEKLEWLKVRKYWGKYYNVKDIIENEFQKTKNFILKEEGFEPLSSIIEIINFSLTLASQVERQKYIKFQMDNNNGENKLFQQLLKLLFYLFSTDSEEPRKRVLALADRFKLSIQEKQKFFQLLKQTKENNILLKQILNITDEDIGFGATYILYSTLPVEKRIKQLEDFHIDQNENAVKYKGFFEINDKLILDVIKFVKEKYSKKHMPEKILEKNIEEKNFSAENKEKIIQEVQDDFKETVNEEDSMAIEKDIDLVLGNVQKDEKEKTLEFAENSSTSFTDNDIEKIEEKSSIVNKSLNDIIKEQKIRDDFKKSKDIISKEPESLTESTNKEKIEEIRKIAHELYEDKNKEKEEKVNELLAYLTTCFPEAISNIISEEILPIFRQEVIDLDVHNLLETINNSIFKQIIQGKDVSHNLEFFEKRLSGKTVENIKTIAGKIKAISKKVEKEISDKIKETEGYKKAGEIVKKSEMKIKQDIKNKPGIEKVSEDKEEIENENFEDFTEHKSSENINIPINDIEDTLIGMTSFIKPHLIILNIVRQNSELKEEDFDTEARRKIIDKLFDEGKIFTYDGTTYIGSGQINNIARSNVIPSTDKAVFIRKLDDYLDRFKTKEEIFHFMGINDEMEFRQLNYILDKYSGNRKKTNPLLYSEIKDEKEKTMPAKVKLKARLVEKSKEVIKTFGNEVDEELENIEIINKNEKIIEKPKKSLEKKEDKGPDLKNIKKQQKEFISNTQKDLLNVAFKEINKNLEKLIKQADTKNDLDAIYRNYFGNDDASKKNLLNLCYNIKKIADIINKDKFLFSKLTFNREKLKKLCENKIKKIKK